MTLVYRSGVVVMATPEDFSVPLKGFILSPKWLQLIMESAFYSENLFTILPSVGGQVSLPNLWVHGGGYPRGVTFTKIVRGCACRTSKIRLFLYQFLPNFPPISIPFLKERHPILTKLGAFYNNLPKIHPIYELGSFVSDENPIAIPNFAKKRPKRQAHIRTPCQCENPPGGYHMAIFALVPNPKYIGAIYQLRTPCVCYDS